MDTHTRVKRALAKYGIVDDIINSKINSAAASVELTSLYVDVEVESLCHYLFLIQLNIFIVRW
jgi:hypothetical protein